MSSLRLSLALISIVTIAGLATLGGCYNPSNFDAVSLSDTLFSLKSDSSQLYAEGDKRTRIVAKIPSYADSSRRVVKFTTTMGSFEQASETEEVEVNADVNGEAIVFLYRGIQVGQAKVQAVAQGITRVVTVTFLPSVPVTLDTLQVDAGTFALKASTSESTTVTATLRRKGGNYQTVGIGVEFLAFDSTGSRIGQFRSQTLSDANGSATALYSVGNTEYRGSVKIVAQVIINGETKKGEAMVEVVDPD